MDVVMLLFTTIFGVVLVAGAILLVALVIDVFENWGT